MGRFKTHEEREAKRIRKQEVARQALRERAQATAAKKSHIPFMKQMKKMLFGEAE